MYIYNAYKYICISFDVPSKVHQAAMTYIEAAECFKFSNEADTILYLNEAVTLFLEVGHFRMAAKV